MANSKRLFGVVRRKLLSRSPSSITTIRSSIPETTKEHIAAIKIQAYFRGHLARRAFRALRSLVKLQAVARGVLVRRQARIALHCMHALARLQVRVRARRSTRNKERRESTEILTRLNQITKRDVRGVVREDLSEPGQYQRGLSSAKGADSNEDI
ncbi:hypothetical protein IGI04_037307 [Brassica rapa subsp. trilocularis]|uniref:DUF4005 domain-containing protein n=1 Tax=Brassica rapa subsp. trilocularis TaxID=1813537 RepID=A0ABQ7LH09_BRACM|nr:hypothetical protein IGI04_037307 [Brassica rapa subsp. trilocularis]